MVHKIAMSISANPYYWGDNVDNKTAFIAAKILSAKVGEFITETWPNTVVDVWVNSGDPSGPDIGSDNIDEWYDVAGRLEDFCESIWLSALAQAITEVDSND